MKLFTSLQSNKFKRMLVLEQKSLVLDYFVVGVTKTSYSRICKQITATSYICVGLHLEHGELFFHVICYPIHAPNPQFSPFFTNIVSGYAPDFTGFFRVCFVQKAQKIIIRSYKYCFYRDDVGLRTS